MILEGIVTTINVAGGVNIAPMGPRVDADSAGTLKHFELRPFRTSTTYQNLKRAGEGVLHVTDDVWVLAQAAIGDVRPAPEWLPTQVIQGRVLATTCRWHEFRVTRLDDSNERTSIQCDVVHTGRLRDFFGFNRAKHAVVEAAILATRVHLIAIATIQDEFKRLAVLVEKTGGESERRAFQSLADYVAQCASREETS